MATHYKLTKLSGEKSHETSLEIGQSIKGVTEEGWMFPPKPTVGRPFVIGDYEGYRDYVAYRTSEVLELVENETRNGKFKTHNSVYEWEII